MLSHSQSRSKDIITLFHKPSSPASVRVLALLKQASANASVTSTEDQASSTPAQSRQEFELNITEDNPTSDQVQTILGYVGASGISSIIKGAKTENEALKKFRENAENFQRPVVCTTILALALALALLLTPRSSDCRLEQRPGGRRG